MVKSARLEIVGDTGDVCVHTGANDVVVNPFLDLTRVLFHSNLTYPRVIMTWEGVVDLYEINNTGYSLGGTTLFEHGQPGIPMTLGYITKINAQSVKVPLVGSVAVQLIGSHARFVSLGTDETKVYLFDNVYVRSSVPVFNLEVVVHVFDVFFPT